MPENYKENAEIYFRRLKELREKYEDNLLFVNMDEVNIPFEMGTEDTLNQKGNFQLLIITHTKAKESRTIAPAVTSDGDVLFTLI